MSRRIKHFSQVNLLPYPWRSSQRFDRVKQCAAAIEHATDIGAYGLPHGWYRCHSPVVPGSDWCSHHGGHRLRLGIIIVRFRRWLSRLIAPSRKGANHDNR